MSDLFNDIKEKAEPVIDKITETAKPVIDKVTDAAEPVLDKVIDAAKRVGDHIGDAIEDLAHTEKNEFFEDMKHQAEEIKSKAADDAEAFQKKLEELMHK